MKVRKTHFLCAVFSISFLFVTMYFVENIWKNRSNPGIASPLSQRMFLRKVIIPTDNTTQPVGLDNYKNVENEAQSEVLDNQNETVMSRRDPQERYKEEYAKWRQTVKLDIDGENLCIIEKSLHHNSDKSCEKKCGSTVDHYDALIVVLVYNKPVSLVRLLESLNRAFYYNDSVRLEVWIDKSKNNIVSQEVLLNAINFNFDHGNYCVFVRPSHTGIFGQWIYTWNPFLERENITVILEDDLTVSPYFYMWLKIVHRKYQNKDNFSGYSLQGISIKHATGQMRVIAPKDSVVYLYPVLGTWGFSPKRESWKQFLIWFHTAFRNASFHPITPGLVTSEWYKVFLANGKANGMWSVWHIYHAWQVKQYTLYPWIANGTKGLTVNWKDDGLHYSGKQDETVEKDLLMDWNEEYGNLPDNPVVLDASGKLIS